MPIYRVFIDGKPMGSAKDEALFSTREEAQRWVDFIQSVPVTDGPVKVEIVEYREARRKL